MTFDTVAYVAYAILASAGALCAARLVMGPSLAQRVVALDALLIVMVSGIAVDAARTGHDDFLNVLVVLSLVGFAGTVTAAWLIDRRGGG